MPSQKLLKQLVPLAIVLGFLGLAAAAVIWLLQRQFDMSVRLALAFGVLAFAVAVLLDPGTVLTWLQGRQARYGSNVVLMSLAFVGILGIVNYLIINGPLPTDWKRKDLTQDQSNTLSPETVAAIQALPAPVKAIGFFTASAVSQKDSAKRLLDQYQALANGRFTSEYLDPVGNPTVANSYGITHDATVVLVMGQEKQELSYVAETEVTGALIRLANPTSRVIYFLTGHGERDIAATATDGIATSVDLLKKQNYDVRTLSLQVTSTVPSDARELVVAGALKPVTAAEVKAIGDYLSRGGSLVVLSDPAIQGQTAQNQAATVSPADDPLADYLRSAWGLNLEQDVIVDPYNSYYDGQNMQPLFPLNKGYETSPITTRLQNVSTGFPLARSIQVFGTADTFPDLKYTPLVKTDPRAWGEVDMQSLASGQLQQHTGDVAGPLTLGVTAENSKTKARVVVFGDSDFASNQFSNAGANSLLFLNSVNWASQEDSLINLTPKVPTTRTLNIVGGFTMNLIFFITVIVMPGTVFLIGLLVWALRRRHV
jgi:ABC-type uncharacterized transport system involved in gliding motility auxiliary subunit